MNKPCLEKCNMDEFHFSIIVIKNWLLLFVFGFKWNSKDMTFFHTMEIWFDDIYYKKKKKNKN
jgi:hypothetical protein